ncbi:GNAT family N-acetyltransferase [uncultured Bacteroides sp.]|uniref:GNAT family N-acetyltransferase n=1 Tax=uncultured Bacteroides sp. TaxID=162156 RepID=UPI002AAA6A06|nr:GNAT family N-acetyltransferase [uncultured Bacteroides sp.]
MDIVIRQAKEQDFPPIFSMIQDFAAFENCSEKLTSSLEQMINEKEYINCFIAETDSKEIVGYVVYFFAYYTWAGKSLYMDDLYVKEGFRGKGIGSRLIGEVVDFAKKGNCHKLRWQVSNWNKSAIDFYTSLGAEIDNVEQNCDLIF